MLTINVIGEELYDELTNEFTTVGDVALQLEHSLVSLSKWESRFEKPFLGKGEKTKEEVFEYLKCMVLTEDVAPEVYLRLSRENIQEINDYIETKQSATTFFEGQTNSGLGETITAELIYYWMVALTIPFECQYWHLNRLFSLIRVCSIKNSPPKKMGPKQLAERNRELNAQRKAKYNTSG